MTIRKTIFIKEIIRADGFGEPCTPITRIGVAAVIKNPYAGRFAQDLSLLFDIGGQLGEELMAEAVKMLGGSPVSYGKAALIGVDGDMEHGGAVIHPKLGKPMRAAIGGGKDNVGAPHVFLRRAAVRNDRFKLAAIGSRDVDDNSCSHDQSLNCFG